MIKFTRKSSVSQLVKLNAHGCKYAKAFLLACSILTISGINAQEDTTGKKLEEVVVTGQYKPQSLKSSVYQVRVISKDQIQKQAASKTCTVPTLRF
jgi:outer membrane cobalamin receptor